MDSTVRQSRFRCLRLSLLATSEMWWAEPGMRPLAGSHLFASATLIVLLLTFASQPAVGHEVETQPGQASSNCMREDAHCSLHPDKAEGKWDSNGFKRKSLKKSVSPVLQESITLVSHVSMDRLDSLERQALLWKGPVSAAVYVTDGDGMEVDCIAKVSSVLAAQSGSIDLVIVFAGKENSAKPYPINMLRQAAFDRYIHTLEPAHMPLRRCRHDCMARQSSVLSFCLYSFCFALLLQSYQRLRVFGRLRSPAICFTVTAITRPLHVAGSSSVGFWWRCVGGCEF